MNTSVKLSAIVERLKSATTWAAFYLDKGTGEIIPITTMEFIEAKKLTQFEEEPDGKPDVQKIAKDIINGDERYIKIPSKYDIDEYGIMERFCFTIDDERISLSLTQALKRKLFAQYFEKTVNLLGVIEEWHSFHFQERVVFAKKWCERNDVDFIDDL